MGRKLSIPSHKGNAVKGKAVRLSPSPQPNIVIECPALDGWYSLPRPYPRAEAQYILHLRETHGGGLQCYFCPAWVPDFAMLAHHVKVFGHGTFQRASTS